MEAKMQTFLHQFQDLKIQLEEITSATNNFDDKNNCIGVGGFGKVYKGELSRSTGRCMVAIKRLNPMHGQGIPEFLKEITMLSRYKHDNLVSFLGFCYEGNEMILVYEHASHGSLDRHLSSPHLTWTKRLKICLDVAKGLSYLHDPRGTHQRLIHCDVKSANILLDDRWNAKLSDFGLSIVGSANEQHSVVVINAVGTHGYCDPEYAMTHTLTKESDVYSFGVVLFEVLCGKLCCTYTKGLVQQILVPTWIECYKETKLDNIIFKNLAIQPINQSALQIFSDIAYQCLEESRKDRPKMSVIVTELETAFRIQELSERNPLFDYEEMTKTAEPPLKYNTIGELWKLLSKGVLLNGGKTWFSLNKKGEHYERISFEECLVSSPSNINPFYYWSRSSESKIIKTHVKPQFMSPGVTYTVNLVFKCTRQNVKSHDLTSLKYKLEGEAESSISYLAYKGEDGQWMYELYQFTSDHRTVDLEILFDPFSKLVNVESIEFRPIEKEDEKLDMQPISDSDTNWEENLPIDYEDMMKWSTDSIQWITKKEAYSIIRKGFLINEGTKVTLIGMIMYFHYRTWFFLDKNGMKCHMLSARVASISGLQKRWSSLPESRFGEVIFLNFWRLSIKWHVQSQIIWSQTTYASYLVYKLPEVQSGFQAPIKVTHIDSDSYDSCWYIHLASPQTPVIRPNADQNTYNPLNRPKVKRLPHRRDDGWMEVQIWEFQTITPREMNHTWIRLELTTWDDKILNGLVIEGLEFRPI